MKKFKVRKFEKHLRKHGCVLDHEGGDHSIWYNLKNGMDASLVRHEEIKQGTADAICIRLDIPLYR
jgi:hypothetical protein